MKQWVIAGTLAVSVAFAGAALAQQSTPQTPKQPPAGQPPTATKPGSPTGEQPAKTPAKPRQKKPAAGTAQQAETRTPIQQPTTTQEPTAPEGALALGTVHIPKAVKADGKPLPAGTYQVRLTAEEAKPDAVGTSGKLERWVEFTQRGQVKGREVVTIVPQSEIKMVQKDAPPAAGGSKVQMLKGDDYLRVWINKGGNHYLIHLVP